MSSPRAERSFFRRGGWLLLLAAALVLAAAAWRTAVELRTGGRERGPGDGRDPRTYGFDLSNLAWPESLLVAGGLPRDGLPSLDRPPLLTPAGVDSLNAAERGKYLVSTDRVLGLVIGGEARCWPLRVLNWHEVCDDTLAGVPVAATWSPLSGCAAVYDRRCAGDTLDLGVSGLLLDSNTLFYERGPTPSLWSQLLGRAVAGPRAGDALTPLPAVVTTWALWRAAHPGTTVPDPAPGLRKRYESSPYQAYRSSGRPRFPAAPPVAGEALEPLVVVEDAGGRAVFSVTALMRAASGGTATVAANGVERRFAVAASGAGEPPTAWLLLDSGAAAVVHYADRFAWHAFHPEDVLP